MALKYIIIFVLSLLICFLLLTMFNTDKNTRRPAVAGSFYPKDPNVLRKTVQTYLDEAPDVNIDGEIFAVMAPHAGYVYSAHVAAPAYKLLSRIDFDTVVIIGHDGDVLHFQGRMQYGRAARGQGGCGYCGESE